jgi:hypothetical protein
MTPDAIPFLSGMAVGALLAVNLVSWLLVRSAKKPRGKHDSQEEA